MMFERGRGKQSYGRYAEVAAVLVGDILVGALGAAADIQMPEVFEIVFSAGFPCWHDEQAAAIFECCPEIFKASAIRNIKTVLWRDLVL